ncbi:hypothetical protein D1B33_06345 [Lysinibacillus yapensis]|uniref:Competence protein ComG n=1 Tax=Ureibacillus yapensis TaxID=2304605 RepID=A0A396SIE8_9BACL|nr:hypothetical protein [Lysinibacillus yapensis]RHW38495.1 hypothetical protein D1B33_06345 [Lysinibacillus yapensis]
METLLSVVIILMLTGSLIPLTNHLKSSLYNQKTELHASETALQAAKMIKTLSIAGGMILIEQNQYEWTYDGEQICVGFNNTLGAQRKCITRNETNI